MLDEGKLNSKMLAGDLFAIEAKYHAKCLVRLCNRARQVKAPTTNPVPSSSPTCLHELAFAELIAYIDEQIEYQDLQYSSFSTLLIKTTGIRN